MTTRLALCAALLALPACAVDIGDGEGLSTTEMVSRNARLAAEQCGPGKVASVDTKGFVCAGATRP